jgi:hypothetical protein
MPSLLAESGMIFNSTDDPATLVATCRNIRSGNDFLSGVFDAYPHLQGFDSRYEGVSIYSYTERTVCDCIVLPSQGNYFYEYIRGIFTDEENTDEKAQKLKLKIHINKQGDPLSVLRGLTTQLNLWESACLADLIKANYHTLTDTTEADFTIGDIGTAITATIFGWHRIVEGYYQYMKDSNIDSRRLGIYRSSAPRETVQMETGFIKNWLKNNKTSFDVAASTVSLESLQWFGHMQKAGKIDISPSLIVLHGRMLKLAAIEASKLTDPLVSKYMASST